MWENHPVKACNPSTLREAATAFQTSRVLLTAIELRLFSHIRSEALTSAEVADRAGTDPHATDRLLNALCALNLLAKDRGRFRNTPDGARYLVDSSPDYAAGLAHSASMWIRWSTLTDTVRHGRAAGARQPLNDRGDAWLEPFIAAMHYRARVQADAVAALLPLGAHTRVLDVGGGSGAFSIAMARRAHGLRAVVFDLPNVIPIAARYIAQAGASDAVTTVAGDYLRDPLPGGGFDLVFLSAVVHSNDAVQNAALIAACAGSLNPGGSVVIMDWVMAPDRVTPEPGALFAINMLVGTDDGDTFTEAEIHAWLTAAGLDRVERKPTPFGTDLVFGRRR